MQGDIVVTSFQLLVLVESDRIVCKVIVESHLVVLTLLWNARIDCSNGLTYLN